MKRDNWKNDVLEVKELFGGEMGRGILFVMSKAERLEKGKFLCLYFNG